MLGATTTVAGAAALASVGCGDDDDDDTGGSTTNTPTGSGGSTTPQSNGSDSRGAPAGTLRAAVASLMDQSADPFYQTGGLSQPVNTHLFESFFRTNDDGQRTENLAESYEISPDRMQITFKMRKGVKFWNGTEMTANDAVWSHEAYLGRTPPHPSAVLTKGQIDSVTAPDESTVVLKLKAPTPFQGRELFLWNISSEAFYNEVGDDRFKNEGMATGPFKLVRNEKGQFMEFEAHEEHWNKDRLPYVKTLRLQVVPELTTRLAQLRAGEADITEGVTGATALQLQNEPNIKIVTSPETAWLKINMFQVQEKLAPWTDKRLREAMIISVNQEEIAKGLLRQGRPSPNVQLWPKTLGYDEKLFPVRKYDPERAKQLIKEAGLEGFGFTLFSYSSSSYPLIPEVAQAIAGFWKAIGLNPQISTQEAGGYFTQFTSRALEGVGVQGWPFFPDARLIAYQYYKTGSGYGCTDNFPEIDGGIEEMVAAESEEEQLEIAQRIHKFVYDEMLFSGAPWSDSQWATTDKVKAWIRPAGDPYMTRLESAQIA